ncbi:MAG: P-loop NTPase [Candidatus Binataceae bacterium]
MASAAATHYQMRIFNEVENDAFADPRMAEELARVKQNLATVKTVIAVAGAKGGVGKSAITVNVGAALALGGRKVGILDADLNCPSVLAMLGMKRPPKTLLGGEGLEPWSGPLGLRIAASGMIVEGDAPPISFVEEEPVVPAANGNKPVELGYTDALRRLLGHTRFGTLDLLLIDLAPGLDRLHQLAGLVALSGILLVSQPSELAVRALRNALKLAAEIHSSVLGIVENMAGFSCGGCHSVRPLMPHGDMANFARESGLPILGRLPFDTRLAEACDDGTLFVRDYADSPLAKQLNEIARALDMVPAAQSPLS